MENKQTAIDWFQKEHIKLLGELQNQKIGLLAYLINYDEILNKAKSMEKEQILLARLNGFEESAEGFNHEYPTMTKEETELRIKNEEYYNEIYGKI